MVRCAFLLVTALVAAGCGARSAASRDGGAEAAASGGDVGAPVVDVGAASGAEVAADVGGAGDASVSGPAEVAPVPDGACPFGNSALASASTAGAPANEESNVSQRMAPSASNDGRYVAFASHATNLVAGVAFPGVYLRDTCRGAGAACVPVTTLVSVTTDGKPPDGPDQGMFASAVISGTGRYVAFESSAVNLFAGDGNARIDIYVRDTCLGAAGACTPSTTRASATNSGAEPAYDSVGPVISRDGRYVVFHYNGDDLATNIDAGTFMRDTCLGATACTPRTFPVSVLSNGTVTPDSFDHALSPDGRYVLFSTPAPGDGSGNLTHLYLRDTCNGVGAGCAPSTTWVNPGLMGAAPDKTLGEWMVTPGGRHVVFASFATNMVAGDKNNVGDIFVRDTCIGAGAACTPATIRASLGHDGGEGNGHSSHGVATDDGRYVFFLSTASTLAADDHSAKLDLFVRDTCLGAAACTPTTRLVVKACGGAQPNDDIQLGWPTPDGRLVIVTTAAKDLVSPALGAPGPHVFVVTTGL